jgi:hypothetical protein
MQPRIVTKVIGYCWRTGKWTLGKSAPSIANGQAAITERGYLSKLLRTP